jgi:hypothetical protein
MTVDMNAELLDAPNSELLPSTSSKYFTKRPFNPNDANGLPGQ